MQLNRFFKKMQIIDKKNDFVKMAYSFVFWP